MISPPPMDEARLNWCVAWANQFLGERAHEHSSSALLVLELVAEIRRLRSARGAKHLERRGRAGKH